MLKLIEPIPDALITTDTTSYPWTLNVVRADDTDATELRYSRNMEEITEEVLDTDFATRLYPLGYGEGVNQLNIKSVNGGVAYIDSPTQALWGVVSKPYVDTTITDAATLRDQGRFDQAIAAYEDIRSKNPKLTTVNLALDGVVTG